MNIAATIETTRPRALRLINVLMGITIMRFMMIALLPGLEMFGGVQPDAWLGPMVSDVILGAMVPLMIYINVRKTGIKLWAGLIVYNAIGAFDYAHGIITEWTDPLIQQGMFGNPYLTFGMVGFSLIVQLLVIRLLVTPQVMSHFTKNA